MDLVAPGMEDIRADDIAEHAITPLSLTHSLSLSLSHTHTHTHTQTLRMASPSITISTSPKSGNGEGTTAAQSSSPRGQCLCSPTTHQGSFRCRLHRSRSSSAWMTRSKSMPENNSVTSLSPKSAEST
uniref:Peroxiredoxins prx-1 prx-2 prx-3 n=1 Tax=Rhizophora mucronata TaxID=61149 RepID=A0A2P2LDI8_RHIMU